MEIAILALGCFWGPEINFSKLEGVESTEVGYCGGNHNHTNYKEVCSGFTGHNETVLIVYNPNKVSYHELLITFWEQHDPTQGMRQGGDVGTQYRSGIYYFNEDQMDLSFNTKKTYQKELSKNGFGSITTEILKASNFYYAEHNHQQYLAKNPDGYCGVDGTGIKIS